MSIKLKHSGGNSVSLNPPTSAPTSSEVAFKLPNADGSAGQYMKTDGSGNLAFATVATPSVTGTLVAAYNDGQTNESTTSTTDTWTDTNISITLTPAAAANKFLCIWDTHCKVEVDTNNTPGYGKVRLIRDSTPICETHKGSYADNNYGQIIGMGGSAWDHPNTTSSVTYKLQFFLNSNGNGSYMAFNWSAWGFTANGSNLTILEFKQ